MRNNKTAERTALDGLNPLLKISTPQIALASVAYHHICMDKLL
jgi:hypothetical protein